jgi:methylmalonyl-CoA/ethylmalonyl-CoA epimerase
MIKRISHVGVAVKNLEETLKFFEHVLDLKPSKKVEKSNMKAAFIPVGDGEIELLEPTDPELPLAAFISKKGEGVHHISIEVEDIKEVIEELKKKGVRLLDEKPRIGVHGVNIAFLNPESTKGILIELCEEERACEKGTL